MLSWRWKVSAMSHSGQRTTSPQAGHWMCVEKPRRLSSRITCPSSRSAASIACRSGRLTAPPRRFWSVTQVDRSPPRASAGRSRGGASRAACTRPDCARCQTLERRAWPSPAPAGPLRLGPAAGHVAGVVPRGTVLLERRLVLLVQRRSGPGAAWGRTRRCGRRPPPAPRRPAIRCQCRCRSTSLRWLCSTATWSNRARNRPTVCGVRLISGTSTIA